MSSNETVVKDNWMSPITRRRFQKFLKQKRAWVGMIVFGACFMTSMFAEFWSHSNPIIMIRDQVALGAPAQPDGSSLNADGSIAKRKIYLPVFFDYSVQEFGITDSFIVDYKALIESDQSLGRKTFSIFPINRWDAFSQTPEILARPSHEHWLGTDGLGRDVTARLLYGVRVSLTFGLMYWFFSFIFGISIGAVQGYYVGKIDFIAERGKELAEIIPFLPTVIIINGLMKSQSLWVTLFIVVIFAWIGISAQIRAQFLTLRKRDFSEAARALGAGDMRIIFRHILPNSITPVLTLTPFTISAGISTLAILDFLGFGLNPPTPSLGELLQQGRAYIANAPWLIESATVALCLMLISINLVGEALRQTFDPRS